MRLSTGFAVLALVCATGAYAQGYPDRPVTLVVPFPAGGAVDLVARTVGQSMSEQWKQPVLVVNRPGAGGNIGAASVAHATPDGYTLLIGSTALVISPALYAKLSYNVLKDLTPVSQLVATPNVLVVHPSLPVKSVRQLIAFTKSHPGQITDASAGVGSSSHVSLVLFNMLAHTNILHVPYKGAAPAIADVMSGYVAMTFVPMPAATPLVRAGRLRALAVTSLKRSGALPDVPTVAEAGVPGYESTSWTGMLAPGGTPRPIVDKLYASASAALRDPHVKDLLVKTGADIVGNTPDVFAQKIREDVVKWAKVIKAAGIHVK